MKKYGVLGKVWENVVMTVVLSLAMMIIREMKQGSFYQKECWEVLGEDFEVIFLFVGILVTSLQLMYWYYTVEEQKISFGYTRKRCFFEIQKVKLISTAVILSIYTLLNFRQINFEYGKKIIWIMGIFLIVQSVGELASIFQMRRTWFSAIILTITSAIMGFAVGYGAISIINGDSFFSVATFNQTPILHSSIFVIGTLCLVGISWKLWKKAEVCI